MSRLLRSCASAASPLARSPSHDPSVSAHSHLVLSLLQTMVCLNCAVCSVCVAELLQSRFVEKGLAQADCRGFKPHLTIMKLSRATKLRNQVGF